MAGGFVVPDDHPFQRIHADMQDDTRLPITQVKAGEGAPVANTVI